MKYGYGAKKSFQNEEIDEKIKDIAKKENLPYTSS